MDPGAALGKRIRGRPKGSKNKPKNATTAAGQPKRTRGIRVDSTTNRSGKTRRCLDTAMTQDAMATDTLPPCMVETDTNSAAVISAREHDAPFAAPDPASATAATPSPNRTASRPPRQNRLPSILSMYVDTLVAFSPVKEGFITEKKKDIDDGKPGDDYGMSDDNSSAELVKDIQNINRIDRIGALVEAQVVPELPEPTSRYVYTIHAERQFQKQTDNYNCGVFVLLFIELAISDGSLGNVVGDGVVIKSAMQFFRYRYLCFNLIPKDEYY
ncbi:hypothetical protein PF008_g15556 [Phytophthora fragariae]|uniref:Ubiquitin-like protease family profile domain-containing protein n=1 Tax=Phytophthora fragariae TaxID=53985 RepID=A0A6G0RF42_9STRA|nr:hypothetical protein PF008_g15556 [Phytophthora fragariae]